MTFHVGQLVVCVDATPCPYFPGSEGGVTLNAVYRVIEATTINDVHGRPTDAVRIDRHNPIHPVTGKMGFHNGMRFRPIIDEPDNAELIERIKQCRPARKPVEA